MCKKGRCRTCPGSFLKMLWQQRRCIPFPHVKQLFLFSLILRYTSFLFFNLISFHFQVRQSILFQFLQYNPASHLPLLHVLNDYTRLLSNRHLLPPQYHSQKSLPHNRRLLSADPIFPIPPQRFPHPVSQCQSLPISRYVLSESTSPHPMHLPLCPTISQRVLLLMYYILFFIIHL